MQLKTILNHVTDYKSFVFKKTEMITESDQKEIRVTIEPRKNSKPVCSQCDRKCSTYDTQPSRLFEFVPLYAIPVIFIYAMRRANCPVHGPTIEQVPWCDGKNRLTKEYRCFLATWAKRLSWSEVARYFNTSFGKVLRSVQYVVATGMKNRCLDGIESIGVDEVQYRKGHNYLTLVFQICEGSRRLLYVAKDRTEQSFAGFFDLLDRGCEEEERRSDRIRFACSDMWKAYLNVIRDRCVNAIHILDRFHIQQHLNQAVDETRKGDVRKLKEEGLEAVLTGSKWLWLKRWCNLTSSQVPALNELVQYNLRIVKAYFMKEDFARFWQYTSAAWAERFLDSWCTRAMRSRIEPMKKFVRTIREHKPLLMNWFKCHGLSNGIVEGFNTKVKLNMRKSYGFKSYEHLETMLYHRLGDLPEPEITHRFC